jgi:hypothetical protein
MLHVFRDADPVRIRLQYFAVSMLVAFKPGITLPPLLRGNILVIFHS